METIFLTNGDIVTKDFMIDVGLVSEKPWLDVTYGKQNNETGTISFQRIRHFFDSREMAEESLRLIREAFSPMVK